MKTLLVLAFALPLMSCSGDGNSNPKPDGHAIAYEYKYDGTTAYPLAYYSVNKDNDGTIRISWSRPEGPEIHETIAPEDFFEKIDALVAEHKLYRLKSEYRPPFEILDGYRWHVYIRFERNSISSGGYNEWPPADLEAGIDAINDYIKSIIE